MSYSDFLDQPDKEPIDIVEHRVEVCALVFGQTTSEGTCPASGEPCINSIGTCQAPSAYTPAAELKRLFFCTAVSRVPNGMIPLVARVEMRPGQIDPERSLGRRGTLAVTYNDAPHDDIGIDPYLDQRLVPAEDRGTFWPRHRARWPYYQNREVYYHRGFVHHPFNLANCETRIYITENLEGWGRGAITHRAVDILKLADNDRKEFPVRTNGELVGIVEEEDQPSELLVRDAALERFTIEPYEPVGVVCLGGAECFQYTGAQQHSPGVVRLTGVIRGAPGSYITQRDSHDDGTEVQKCAYIHQQTAPQVLKILLNAADIPDEQLDIAGWEEKNSIWLTGLRFTRLITSPDGVRKHLDEWIPQSSTWGVWWDELSAQVGWEPVRPADVDEPVAHVTDGGGIVRGTANAVDESDRLINQIYVAFGQVDPTGDIEDESNYRGHILTRDQQSISEYRTIKRQDIFSRWHPLANRAELLAIKDRLLRLRSEVPIRLEFSLERKDDAIGPPAFIDVTTMALLDGLGYPRSGVRLRVHAVKRGDAVLSVSAREELGRLLFARIAPNEVLAGLTWDEASEDLRRRYMFLADDDGRLGAEGQDPGKILL